MTGLIIRWIVNAVALYVAAQVANAVGFHITLSGAVPALIAVAVLAVVNAFIRPLVVLLTLPLNCLTFGLFSVVINAVMFLLVGSGFIEGFRVSGFVAALIGSIVMGIVNGMISNVVIGQD
ncbi:MAG: phage holin family protein [Armatimonadetes bacterium]|nr:phage holin family protein [Armatimonadota bacterium]